MGAVSNSPSPPTTWPEECQLLEACDSARQPSTTAWDALGDLDEPDEDLALSGRWADLLPSIPEGETISGTLIDEAGCRCLGGGPGTGVFS